MKKLIFLLPVFLLLVGFPSEAQTQSKKLTKAERKALAIAKSDAEYQRISDLVAQRQFVLEAGFISNQYGYRAPVNSMINFIKVDSSDAVIQVGSDFGVGYNGLGGITLNGRITKWKVSANPTKRLLTVSMNVMTNVGTYFVTFYAGSSERAEASVSGMQGGKLYYSGRLYAPGESRIFKGTPAM
jgi:hypothetical protein